MNTSRAATGCWDFRNMVESLFQVSSSGDLPFCPLPSIQGFISCCLGDFAVARTLRHSSCLDTGLCDISPQTCHPLLSKKHHIGSPLAHKAVSGQALTCLLGPVAPMRLFSYSFTLGYCLFPTCSTFLPLCLCSCRSLSCMLLPPLPC